jgi:hypothetical protein
MSIDPLDQIFTDTEQVEQAQREELAALIIPYAAVNRQTGAVYFKPTTDELNSKQKLILYLLCRLALSALPDSPFPKFVTPKEIERDTELPGGTIRPKLTQLVDEKIVVKSGEGYRITPTSLHRVKPVWPNQE